MLGCLSHADVAQLVEHHLAKVRVAGSNPVVRSTRTPCPKGVCALDLRLVCRVSRRHSIEASQAVESGGGLSRLRAGAKTVHLAQILAATRQEPMVLASGRQDAQLHAGPEAVL